MKKFSCLSVAFSLLLSNYITDDLICGHFQGDKSAAEQRLVVFVKDLIYSVHVEDFVLNESRNDNVGEIGVAERETGRGEQVLSLFKIELEGNGEDEDGLLAGSIIFVVDDFGEMETVNVGAIVNG